MAGARIVLNDQGIREELERIDRVAANPARIYHAIGAAMVFSTQRRFETETGPNGQPWPRLSPRTANQRIGRRQRGYANILRVTGRLYGSITYQADAAGAEWGTNVVYAAIHQFGGTIQQPERSQRLYLKKTRRKGVAQTRFARANAKGAEPRDVTIGAHTVTIPARPYLGLSEADRSKIASIVAEQLRAEGGRP